jgi:hypothetical protein
MKILINENQFLSIVSEGKSHTGELCSHFGVNSVFCQRISTFIKNNKGNSRRKSKDFFKDVLKENQNLRSLGIF